ncbi:uncharacterized protein LOC117114535 [Anneissia japonica]|uniref:uncharacterized protein LOC117114535 n=1 Tax=Anneissia japonica TaxID=1529436 RepID=UPI00142593F3|nr:uncharacterized protein LOC117114535 [Anneissia japonica]
MHKVSQSPDLQNQSCLRYPNLMLEIRGFSLLHALARSGYASCIRQLLTNIGTTSINRRTKKDGNTPLHFCMFNENVPFKDRYDTAKVLIQNGANAALKNKIPRTPVEEYAKFRYKDTEEQKEQMLLLLATDTHGTVKVRTLTIEQFMKALSEGTGKANFTRLMVMGNERVGKSCLVDSLLGKKFEENKQITDSIAITKASISEAKDWTESDKSELIAR